MNERGLQLGTVYDGWMAVSFDATGRVVLAKIPDGETPQGLGHTWFAKDVAIRVVAPEPLAYIDALTSTAKSPRVM